MSSKSFFRYLFLLTFLMALAASAFASSIDYTQPKKRAYLEKPPQEDRVQMLALSLGRSGGELSQDDSKRIFNALFEKKPIDAELNFKWQRLLRMAQTQVLIEANPQYFSTGYEFEAGSHSHYGWDDFDEGVKEYRKILAETVGFKGLRELPEKDGKMQTALKDDAGRVWPVVSEFVWPEDPWYGWEQVTPPFMSAEDLRGLTAFRTRLGKSKFGVSNDMTGLHQTSAMTPKGAPKDPHIEALTAVNYQLLRSKYLPVMFDVLDVKRGGGPTNFFLRPLVFDHEEMLKELMATEPGKFTPDYLRYLMRDKYVDQEFEAQVKNDWELHQDTEEAAEKWKMIEKARKGTKADRANVRTVWKYRDSQLKDLGEGENRLLLVENRIGDYVNKRPEITMLQTYLDQLLLNKAYELAKKDQVYQWNIPPRPAGASDDDYWKVLASDPEVTVEKMLKEVGITDANIANFVRGKAFKVKNVNPPISKDGIRYAFEAEGDSEGLVRFILPTDPELRSKWRRWSEEEKVAQMERMGLEFDGTYSPQKFHTLTTEFRADIEKYPFLSPDLHLEASGNWEIKSSPSAILDEQSLRKFAKQILNRMDDEEWLGFHMHAFIPEHMLKDIKGEKADEFVDNLERRSLQTALDMYATADTQSPAHNLDSWSLDRYSPRDLEQVRQHLNGQIKLSSLDQKYHNIAYRPFKGGVDLELRVIDEEIDLGADQLKDITASLQHKDFGGIAFHQDEPMFHEFRDAPNPEAVKRYTLEDAVSKKYPLTDGQKELLRKMQFEIYKPSMGEYLHFDEFSAVEETPPHLRDPKFVRTNFESNVAFPLLNYEGQSYLNDAEKAKLAKAREAFVDRVHALMKEIEAKPEYEFLRQEKDFLHLADYMRESTHPDMPELKKLSNTELNRQKKLLEKLTFRLRSLSVKFVKESRVDQMVGRSIPTAAQIQERAKAKNALQRAASDTAHAARGQGTAVKCESLFERLFGRLQLRLPTPRLGS